MVNLKTVITMALVALATLPHAAFAQCESVVDPETTALNLTPTTISMGRATFTVCYDPGLAVDLPLFRRWVRRTVRRGVTHYGFTGYPDYVTTVIFLPPVSTRLTNWGTVGWTAGGNDRTPFQLELHYLAPSAPSNRSFFSHEAKTNYHSRLIVHEMTHFVQGMLTHRPDGPDFRPQHWIREGHAEYEGYLHSTEWNRTTGVEKLLAEAKEDNIGADVFCCRSLRDTRAIIDMEDVYDGGALTVMFLAEQFGEDFLPGLFQVDLPSLLRDEGMTVQRVFTRFRSWYAENVQRRRQPSRGIGSDDRTALRFGQSVHGSGRNPAPLARCRRDGDLAGYNSLDLIRAVIRTVSIRFVVCYDADYAEDVDFFRRWTKKTMRRGLDHYGFAGPLTMKGGEPADVLVYLPPVPTIYTRPGRAVWFTVGGSGEERHRYELHYMTPSAWSDYGSFNPNEDWHAGLVTHEMMHAVQYGLEEASGYDPPKWVWEGVAEYERFFHSTESTREGADRQLVYLSEKDDIPSRIYCCRTLRRPGMNTTDLYVGGALAITFLVDEFGEDVLPDLFRSDLRALARAEATSIPEVFARFRAWYAQKVQHGSAREGSLGH